jgi:hypothetical protein
MGIAMGIDDLLGFLGERDVARPDVPADLAPYVEEALDRGLVIEDCRDRLASVA